MGTVVLEGWGKECRDRSLNRSFSVHGHSCCYKIEVFRLSFQVYWTESSGERFLARIGILVNHHFERLPLHLLP